MDNNINNLVNFTQLEYILNVLGECTDDYMFLLDFWSDYYMISDRAVTTFALNSAKFYHATDVIDNITFPEDVTMIHAELLELKNGTKEIHNMEYRWLDKFGNPIWINCRGQILWEDGKVRYLVGSIIELGRKNKVDNATNLYRENVLRSRFAFLQEISSFKGFLMIIGVDNFKDINEKYGFAVGDDILHSVSECIRAVIGSSAELYRLDGDEFAVFNMNGSNTPDRHMVKNIYKEIRGKVDAAIDENGYHIFYTISAGAVLFDSSEMGYKDVFTAAKFALHTSKRSGKNHYVEYDEDRYAEYMRKLDIQEELRKSIANHFEGFELYYQPIVGVDSQEVHGAEALVRWNSRKYGFMTPDSFIHLLEESSLIIPLGRWIIETAAKQCKAWQKQCPDFRMNINLSYVQLKNSDVMRDANQCVERIDLCHRDIVFEITESGEMEKSTLKHVLKSFVKKEYRLAIDDFGTGYSNLRYIKDMHFDFVKIDRTFIKDIPNNDYDLKLVQQIIELAHHLDLMVCVEGVETKEQFECVTELGANCIQGYYFGRPVPAKDFPIPNVLNASDAKQ